MKVVQEMLGHSSMMLTADTYSHVTPAFKRQAAEAMDAYLAAARKRGISRTQSTVTPCGPLAQVVRAADS
jgi:hypothetical protein